MPKRPKAGDPELLLVSFCDIVTVITAALFMTMVITIQEAMRVPVLKGAPRASRAVAVRPAMVQQGDSMSESTGVDGGSAPVAITKKPVYYECRQQMVFPVNYAELFQEMRNARGKMIGSNDGGKKDAASLLSMLQGQSVGDDYYIVHQSILIPNEMTLQPRKDAVSETEADLQSKEKSKFFASLRGLDNTKQYVVFLVRDDSFKIFRECRRIVNEEGFESGWEYLDDTQPIKFGGIGSTPVMIQ
jgi:hypothetical protein